MASDSTRAGESPPGLEGQQWAIQRRIEDVFAKLGEKFGDLTGRIEVRVKPETQIMSMRRRPKRPASQPAIGRIMALETR